MKGKKKPENYRFSDADTRKIVLWINRHLSTRVAVRPAPGLHDDEQAIIHLLTPLLNIQDNPDVMRELKELRAICRQVGFEG